MSKNKPATEEDQSLAKMLLAANRFPWKLYQIVNACKSGAIGWDESGRIVLMRPEQFKRECLESSNSVFKTKNIGSFVRQLNLYGFHKLQSSRPKLIAQKTETQVIHSFQNELFVRNRLDLLSKLHRNIGIRNRRDTCKCNQKQKRTRVNGDRISSQPPMVLPCVRLNWSSELNPPAKLIFFDKINCLPSISSNYWRPMEEAAITEQRETIYELFFQSDLEIASVGYEKNLETTDVTVVRKNDFDKIVSIFVEMLNKDPDVQLTRLAQMDCSSSPVADDLIGRRALTIRNYEARLTKSVSPMAHSGTMYLPVHDSSFSFSASASRPFFTVADSQVANFVKMSVVDQDSYSSFACMNFDSYKEN